MASDGKTRFSLDYSGSAVLTVDELWPDGDAPENFTEDDVRELIDDHGGPVAILRDWSMDDCLDLHVTKLRAKPKVPA